MPSAKLEWFRCHFVLPLPTDGLLLNVALVRDRSISVPTLHA